MPLYLLKCDDDLHYVEADDFSAASRAFQVFWSNEQGGEADAIAPVESITLASAEPVIREACETTCADDRHIWAYPKGEDVYRICVNCHTCEVCDEGSWGPA